MCLTLCALLSRFSFISILCTDLLFLCPLLFPLLFNGSRCRFLYLYLFLPGSSRAVFELLSNVSLPLYSVTFFFFSKQKTLYEVRISAWSPDVCSSDLGAGCVLVGSSRVSVSAARRIAASLMSLAWAKPVISPDTPRRPKPASVL